MACPNTREFSSWINLRPGSPSSLIVEGEVETNAGNMHPKLSEANPQGINPKILLLNLTIERTGEFGTQDINFRPARFEKPAGQGDYNEVEIFFDGESCFSLEVTEAH